MPSGRYRVVGSSVRYSKNARPRVAVALSAHLVKVDFVGQLAQHLDDEDRRTIDLDRHGSAVGFDVTATDKDVGIGAICRPIRSLAAQERHLA
jgi:hypothetical protein